MWNRWLRRPAPDPGAALGRALASAVSPRDAHSSGTTDPSGDARAFHLGLAAVVLLQAFSAFVYHQRTQVNFSSDQAVPALMALEIRDHGSHPVFYWGVQYGGSLEPHLLSLAFRVLPETVGSYRLVMFGLMATATVLVSLATALGFGRRAGLLAGAYLAAGPSFLFYKVLASDGVYASFLLLTAASVYLTARIVQRAEGDRAAHLFFALGLVLGGLLRSSARRSRLLLGLLSQKTHYRLAQLLMRLEAIPPNCGAPASGPSATLE